jgi:nucleoside-diphosphate-sugar epimerase
LKKNEPVFIPPCQNILLQSVYNNDLADAFVKALDYPDKIRGEIFIISCKKAITLGTYLQTAMEYFNSQSKVHEVSPEELCRIYPLITMRFGLEFLLEHMCFDIEKAVRTIGYEPTRTTQQGLIEAVKWCEANELL